MKTDKNQNDISGNYLHNEVTDLEYTIFRFIMTLERDAVNRLYFCIAQIVFPLPCCFLIMVCEGGK